MNHRKIMGVLFVLSLVGMFLGFVFVYPERFGMCKDPLGDFYPNFCYEDYGESIGDPLVVGLLPSAVVFLILLFMPKYVYEVWKWKFALWYIPMAILFVSFKPYFFFPGLIIPYERATAAVIAGLGFAVTSLFIIFSQFDAKKG